MADTLRLVFIGTGGGVRQVVLTKPELTIGRAEHGDVVVSAETVSSRHGIFRANALGYTYADLGSRNGSALERGGRVRAIPAGEEVQLEESDVLLLGSADGPVRITIEAGVAPFERSRNLARTVLASAPLIELLDRPASELLSLSARALAAEDPASLASAAFEHLTSTFGDGEGLSLLLVGTGFRVARGRPVTPELERTALSHRRVVRLDGEAGTEIIAPLIARGTWHGFFAYPSTGELRVGLDVLGVAASLLALATAALAMRPTVEPSPSEDGPLGTAPAFLAAVELARRLAASDLAVLLGGETGSGKEVFARLVHHHSARKDGPFVAINCGAIPPSLLESELFGHVEGAFTGAVRAHAGVFEQADRGTLFLDELGEMPLSMQAAILRALELGEIRRVGDTKPRRVDVRLVSATHRDLSKMVASGGFRADLLYRLQAAQVRIPPLRERHDDVLLLAHRFLADETRRTGRRLAGLSPEAQLVLSEYAFPGNIRELKNEIARAVALTADGAAVPPSAFSDRVFQHKADRPADAARPRTLKEAVSLAERLAVEQALEQSRGNVSRAAKALGLTRPGLYKVLVRLGLRQSSAEEEEE